MKLPKKQKHRYRFTEIEEGTIDLDALLSLPEDFKEEEARNIQTEEDKVKEQQEVEMDLMFEGIEKDRNDYLERVRMNTLRRDQLHKEVSKEDIMKLFDQNSEYLQRIWNGEEPSRRHKLFNKNIKSRHSLYYSMITEPFTDNQLDWTLVEISKVAL